MTSQRDPVRLLLGCGWRLTPRSSSLLVNACSPGLPAAFTGRAWPGCREVARRLAAPDTLAPPTFETAAQFTGCSCQPAQLAGRHRRSPILGFLALAAGRHLRCYQLAALLQADEADSDDRQQLSQAAS